MFLLGLLLYNFLFRATENNFKIYWGIPSGSCRKFRVDFSNIGFDNGFVQNSNDSVSAGENVSKCAVFDRIPPVARLTLQLGSRGDKIAILYSPGIWPSIETEDGQLIYRNGGLPQNGSLDLHLRQFEFDVDRLVPNRTFDGVAVIDFESWRPSFRQNFGEHKIYKDLTLLEVNRKHPKWTRDQIEAQGKVIFETAAVNFVNRTLLRARKLRPFAKWGYYGFPHCFNRYRDLTNLERCPDQVEAENDKLSFMFPTAIYSSLYITQNQTNAALTKFVQGKMYEAKRMANLTGNSSLLNLPFIRYQYTDTMETMKKEDLMNILRTVKSDGGRGVILWGSSTQFKTAEQCRAFKNYFETDFLSVIKDFRKIR